MENCYTAVAMDKLIELFDNWQTKRVVVVGDFMLDHIIYGNAERLSPDAPVPVLSVEREDFNPGGASNVCMDLAALQCQVTCFGITGNDDSARRLREELNRAGCATDGLVTSETRPTTVKRSYVGLAQHRHPQKMFRADIENTSPVTEQERNTIIQRFERHVRESDVVCVEDYNKGVVSEELCRRLIKLAKKAGVPVIIDPAAIADYSRYRGATAITPNRTEAQLATGLTAGNAEEIAAVAGKLLDAFKFDVVVLTLDKQGAFYASRSGEQKLVPTVARGVYDVTGAGDMVLAALAAGLANGASWEVAVQLANVAAGLEVEKFGVVPIRLEEIYLAVLRQNHSEIGKVRTLDQLLPEINAYRQQGKKIVFTNGCFDLLHSGHIELLRSAGAMGDLLVLAVNSDASIRTLKGDNRPIIPEAERIELLAALECVDYVVLFGDGSGGENDTPIPLLQKIKPDVLVKGGTYDRSEIVGADVVEAYGGEVRTITPVEGVSTSQILKRIRKRHQPGPE